MICINALPMEIISLTLMKVKKRIDLPSDTAQEKCLHVGRHSLGNHQSHHFNWTTIYKKKNPRSFHYFVAISIHHPLERSDYAAAGMALTEKMYICKHNECSLWAHFAHSSRQCKGRSCKQPDILNISQAITERRRKGYVQDATRILKHTMLIESTV